MKKLLTALTLAFLLTSAIPSIIQNLTVINYAQNCLPHQGLLEKTDLGFVYVKVLDEYILETVKLLGDDKIEPPPYFGPGLVGAHITVMDAMETEGKHLKLPLLGKPIPFKIVNFASVDVIDDGQKKRIYFFTVEAPELVKIRKANKLRAKIRGYDFHITAAIENLDTTKSNH